MKKLLFISISGTENDILSSSYVLQSYLNQFKEIKTEYNVCVEDYFMSTDNNKILENIIAHNPYMVCFSCYIWNIDKIKNITRKIEGNIKIVYGGPEIKNVKYDHVDYAIVGEG